MIKPDPMYFQYFILFTSVGLIGLTQGNFKSWWGSGLSNNSALILVIFFIFVGLSSLFLFIKWLLSININNQILKSIFKIILILFLFILLLIFKDYNIIILPSFLYIVMITMYLVYMQSELKKMKDEAEKNKEN